MDKQTFDAMVQQYAADMLRMAERSALPPEPAPAPAEESGTEPEPPAFAPPGEIVEINPPESGPGTDPLQPVNPEPETYERFLADNPKTGILRIQASIGGRAVPVAGAKVTVSRDFTDGSRVLATSVTDSSGIADGIRLPAPDKSQSQSPETGKPPYAAYTVTVSHPQFETQVFTQVPVFEGIHSIQPVRFIPVQPDFQ